MSLTFFLMCVAAVLAGVLLFLIQDRRDRESMARDRAEEKRIREIGGLHIREHSDGSTSIVTPYRVITVPADSEPACLNDGRGN